jgi:hypothetical protein
MSRRAISPLSPRRRCALARALPIGLLVTASSCSARADTVVQIAVDARPVSTLTGGQVTPWTPGQGIDDSDGLVTNAVEASLGQTGMALPDDGTFAADADHPEVVLHFSNDVSATSYQARELTMVGNISFDVPKGEYSKLYLLMSSSYGACTLTVTMTYADGLASPITFEIGMRGSKPRPSPRTSSTTPGARSRGPFSKAVRSPCVRPRSWPS